MSKCYAWLRMVWELTFTVLEVIPPEDYRHLLILSHMRALFHVVNLEHQIDRLSIQRSNVLAGEDIAELLWMCLQSVQNRKSLEALH